MRISCHTCHQIWEVPSGTLLAARLKFALGSDEYSLECPNCHAPNQISKQDFTTSDPQIPVTGKALQTDSSTKSHPSRADNDPASPPTNPIPVPTGPEEVHAIVLDRGLRLLREHNPNSEIMGELKKGEHVIVLDTWSNPNETWIQLGPERWAMIEENGEPLIQLLG